MGQIAQIAFELRNITQQALDEESSSGDEEQDDEELQKKRQEMTSWFNFCKEKINKIEKVWKRKLDRPADSESDEGSE